MKNVTPALLALLQAGGPFVMADMYTVTLTSGTVLRWVDFDRDLTHPTNGFVYSCSGPVLRRGKTRIVIGVEVDTLDLSICPGATDYVDGVPMLAAARAGAFDGAKLKLERVFLGVPSFILGVSVLGAAYLGDMAPVGAVIMFTGRFADVTLGRTELQVRINSDVEALNIQLPRNTYQAGCMHTLYDTECGLNRAAWGVTSHVAIGSTVSTINSGLSNAPDWFTRGYIRFNTGALAGTTRTIKSYAAGRVTVFMPLPAVPAVGDTFTVYAGCDRLQGTCGVKFDNLGSFRATPYTPEPSTAA
ncbi:MAG: DUF2163 domain-containing protein [Formivibrio sp.]|nr:DUF2163 domain-containing protein [Formivibrio sp.]